MAIYLDTSLVAMIQNRNKYLKDIKRIVIKIGSSSLTYPNGLLDLSHIERLVRQIADIHNRGFEIILVSSGAIGAGMGKLGLKKRPETIPEKQAAAAVGQGILLHMYEKIFSEYGKTVAQILLTKDDFTHEERANNVKVAFCSLLKQGVIPIINENDAVAVDEIKVGDNDTLSAMVSKIVKADLLILLSDIDGLYDKNPKNNPDAKLIHLVENIDENIRCCAGGSGSNLGTGGMITKIHAADIATSSGTSMVIANSAVNGIIQLIVNGEEIGTWFNKNNS